MVRNDLRAYVFQIWKIFKLENNFINFLKDMNNI